MKADPHVAGEKATAAKTRLLGTMDQLKARLSPDALKREAVVAMRDKASAVAGQLSDAAAKRPGVTAGITAATVLILLYRPIRWIVRRFLKEK